MREFGYLLSTDPIYGAVCHFYEQSLERFPLSVYTRRRELKLKPK